METIAQHHHKENERTFFGFWVYIMSDCLLFASLFAAFAVLKGSTFGGPTGRMLFDQQFVLLETLILLSSSFICGLAIIAAHKKQLAHSLFLLFLTLLLGGAFLGMELHEFRNLIEEGANFTRSAFLSSFFALVGTHGLHVFFGSLWMIILIVQTAILGLTERMIGRLTLLTLFWHFLDVIWIFIFTFVYLY